jgi:hypothetical protein
MKGYLTFLLYMGTLSVLVTATYLFCLSRTPSDEPIIMVEPKNEIWMIPVNEPTPVATPVPPPKYPRVNPPRSF